MPDMAIKFVFAVNPIELSQMSSVRIHQHENSHALKNMAVVNDTTLSLANIILHSLTF